MSESFGGYFLASPKCVECCHYHTCFEFGQRLGQTSYTLLSCGSFETIKKCSNCVSKDDCYTMDQQMIYNLNERYCTKYQSISRESDNEIETRRLLLMSENYKEDTSMGCKSTKINDYTKASTEFDDVSHPSHYTKGRKYEPRLVIEDWGLGFYLGNVVKYISRAGRKGDAVEDLKKARQYLDWEIEKLENS